MDLLTQNVNKVISRTLPEKQVSFKGRIPDIRPIIKKIADKSVDNLADNITKDIQKLESKLLKPGQGSKFLETIDGIDVVKKTGLGQSALGTFEELIKIPVGILSSLAENLHKKFPKVKLLGGFDNLGFITKYRDKLALSNKAKALQGLYETGAKLIPDGAKIDNAGKAASGKVKDGLNKLLNDSMGFGKSTFDSKYERFWARIVSGFTAAMFLGKDFSNKAKMKGKSDEEAAQVARQKQGQEMVANLGEGAAQFAILGLFAKQSNTKIWFAPVAGALIGLTFHIVSRLASGMPLKRVKVPEQANANKAPKNMEDFISFAKKNEENKTENEQESEQKTKKPLLSLKNIAIACGAIIATGFTLRFAKGKLDKTPLGVSLNGKVQKLKDKFKDMTIEKVYASGSEIRNLSDELTKAGEKELGKDIARKTQTALARAGKDGKILIGTRQKTTKLFGKIEVPTVKLYEALVAPFKFVKDMVTYPYKIARSLAEAAGLIKKQAVKTPVKFKIKNPEALDLSKVSKQKLQGRKLKLVKTLKPANSEDIYDFKNIFLQYKGHKEKYVKPEELTKNFSEYVKKMREVSINSTSASKVDNTASGVMAGVLGTLTGMTFSMNDEFNNSVKVGRTKEEADKDARLRGVNKFFRMMVQGVVLGVLNKTFIKQYNGSLLKVAGLTFVSTTCTDTISRALTGMPFKKMNKEEQETYKEKQKTGKLAWYHKLIDKLAS